MKFKEKPVVIDAIKYKGRENGMEVAKFMSCQHPYYRKENLVIGTTKGVVEAVPGDWIVKDIHGEFRPLNPMIFEAMYEKVDE
jgi:hypothetical protein